MRPMINLNIKASKHADTLKEISSAFTSIRAFLAPKISDKAECEGFILCEEDVRDELKHHIGSFFDTLFRHSLPAFQYKKRDLTCSELADHVERIFAIFECGMIPKAETMLQVMIRYEIDIAEGMAYKYYMEEIRSLMTLELMEEEVLLDIHLLLKDESKSRYRSNFSHSMHDKPEAKSAQKRLDDKIDAEFETILKEQRQRFLEAQRHESEVRESNEVVNRLLTTLQQSQRDHEAELSSRHQEMRELQMADAHARRELERRHERQEEARRTELETVRGEIEEMIRHNRQQQEQQQERERLQTALGLLSSLLGGMAFSGRRF